jgi:hypothetical protein
MTIGIKSEGWIVKRVDGGKMSVVRRRRNDGEERNEKPRAVRVGRR